MTIQSKDDQIQALQAELAKANAARAELVEALARMLKPIPGYQIEQHGGYRHAAALVAANMSQ
jgi:hypothetical protein